MKKISILAFVLCLIFVIGTWGKVHIVSENDSSEVWHRTSQESIAVEIFGYSLTIDFAKIVTTAKGLLAKGLLANGFTSVKPPLMCLQILLQDAGDAVKELWNAFRSNPTVDAWIEDHFPFFYRIEDMELV